MTYVSPIVRWVGCNTGKRWARAMRRVPVRTSGAIAHFLAVSPVRSLSAELSCESNLSSLCDARVSFHPCFLTSMKPSL